MAKTDLGAAAIAAIVFVSALALQPVAVAQMVGDTGAAGFQSSAFRGSIKPSGEIVDSQGKVVGRVVMTNPAVRFNIDEFSVTGNGSVVDRNGVSVGRVVFDTAGDTSAQHSYKVPEQKSVNSPSGSRVIFNTDEPVDLSGITVDQQGRVLDNAGRVIGRIAESGVGAPSNLAQLMIDSSNNARDEAGRVVGRFVRTAPHTAIDFTRISIDPSGRVFTQTGEAVGYIDLTGADGKGSAGATGQAEVRSGAAGSGMSVSGSTVMTDSGGAYSMRTSPPPGLSRRPSPARRAAPGPDKAQAMGPAGGQPSSAEAGVAQKPAEDLLSGTDVADIARRRAKVEQRLKQELQEGRISRSQAAELNEMLKSSRRSEARYRRDGAFSDREVRKLYKSWDRIMEQLDEYLAENARVSVGLRTK